MVYVYLFSVAFAFACRKAFKSSLPIYVATVSYLIQLLTCIYGLGKPLPLPINLLGCYIGRGLGEYGVHLWRCRRIFADLNIHHTVIESLRREDKSGWSPALLEVYARVRQHHQELLVEFEGMLQQWPWC